LLLIFGVPISNPYPGLPIARADAGAGPPIPPGKSNVVVAPAAVAPMPELSWASGAFPVINGKTMFPPLAVPISPVTPAAYSTHWYAGSAFSGTSQTGSWIFTEITTPTSNPKTDEFYYVIASIWDNSGSYDQIGFADAYGVWGLAYSWTSGSCSSPTFHYSTDAMNLALGTSYGFYIYVSGGDTWFEAFVGSTLVWYLNPAAPTSATSLSVAYSYCSSYDYTDYIEVWQTDVSGGYPMYMFTFSQNQWYNGNSWIAASWTAFTTQTVPAAVSVVISGQTVYVGQTQTLTTNVASGSGSVSPNCPSGCSEAVGSSVTVSATPSSGWWFSAWSTAENVSCSTDPCVFTMPSGNVVLRATFTSSSTIRLSLSVGWNLFSLPVVPGDSKITSVLKPILGSVNVVWSYSAPTKSWAFFKPPGSGTLKTMQDGMGYWLYMNAPAVLPLNGTVIAPATVPPTYSLVFGWNLVGFKPQPTVQNETVGQYLMSISGSYDQNNVWIYQNSSGTWIEGSGSTQIQPGQAMWILMTAPATLKP